MSAALATFPADWLARPCRLCPRQCGAIRAQEPGFCGGGAAIRVALAQLHAGEEPCLSGPRPEMTGRGSGTIFFSGCALRCAYCQNHDISMGPSPCPQPGELSGEPPDKTAGGRGHALSVDDLTALMLELQLCGAHNINLVTPSHYAPQVRQALLLAKGHGLSLPVVWNSSAYERVETLRALEGLVDIYLPDLRYMDAQAAARYSAAPDYPAVATRAILEMHRQTGALQIDPDTGLAVRGVLTRLLVLPGDAGRVSLALAWLADTLGPDAAVSLMGQYYPAHRAREFPELARGVAPEEYAALRRAMAELGLERGYAQEVACTPEWTPDFRKN